ncbi:MAG: hypothetical protein FJX46_07850 [Alphaproteobacteria bacterium]|nr:hypothetical protein [Alphaproteobacteria bacterium]
MSLSIPSLPVPSASQAAIGIAAFAAGTVPPALVLPNRIEAIGLAIRALAGFGDNIVAAVDIDPAVHAFLAETLETEGIEIRFIDPATPDCFARNSDAQTRVYFGQALSYPKRRAFPLAEALAHSRRLGIPLILNAGDEGEIGGLGVDPLKLGVAGLVTAIEGGAAILAGTRFDWSHRPARSPMLNRPDLDHEGRVWTEIAGEDAYGARLRAMLERRGASMLGAGNTLAA